MSSPARRNFNGLLVWDEQFRYPAGPLNGVGGWVAASLAPGDGFLVTSEGARPPADGDLSGSQIANRFGGNLAGDWTFTVLHRMNTAAPNSRKQEYLFDHVEPSHAGLLFTLDNALNKTLVEFWGADFSDHAVEIAPIANRLFPVTIRKDGQRLRLYVDGVLLFDFIDADPWDPAWNIFAMISEPDEGNPALTWWDIRRLRFWRRD
jgi:hypothetical protein